jgi:hypothetical protein
MPRNVCEPNIEQLLADPIVGQMMRADRVDVPDLTRMLRAVARRLDGAARPAPRLEVAPRREVNAARKPWSADRNARDAGAPVCCCG